jgi:hypothetical protein
MVISGSNFRIKDPEDPVTTEAKVSEPTGFTGIRLTSTDLQDQT